MTLTLTELADSLEAQALAKRTWLGDFAAGKRAWPQHDIDRKRHEAEVLEQSAYRFRRAAERNAA